MAGASGSLSVERTKRGKQSKRKKKKRVGFRLDMTPLVDITFLLLTFFIMTTTMSKPQIMEMSIPPERFEQVEVKDKDLLTVRLYSDSNVFWNIGTEKPEVLKFDTSTVKKLYISEHWNRGVEFGGDFKAKEKAINGLIIVLKISKEAPYGAVVKMLDIMNLGESDLIRKMSVDKNPQSGKPYMERKRRFTIATMNDEDFKVFEELKAEGVAK